MSLITDQLQGFVELSNNLLGDNFVIELTDEVIKGTFNSRRKTFTDQDGGISELIEHTVVYPRTASPRIPSEREFISFQGIRYQIINTADDAINIRLTLQKTTA